MPMNHPELSPTLIRGAMLITLQPGYPDAFVGDILVRSGVVEAIGQSLPVPSGAEVVDGTNRIVHPGFVNAHMHTWQTGMRGACADWTLPDYLRLMHGDIAPRFSPDDMRLANVAGALNQLSTGTTTLADWCHNTPTPAHTDAAIDGLLAAGVRAVFLHGAPKPKPAPGQPHFSEIVHPRAEIERLLATTFATPGLVSLGMAVLGPHFSVARVAVADLELAREHGLVASLHQSGNVPADPTAWDAVEAAGLVGPKMNVVHANHLPLDRLERLMAAGVTFTSTPEVELRMGHGEPITDHLVRHGALPSLGVDVESVVSGEMVTVARFALTQQRAMENRRTGVGSRSTSLDALRWATEGGARAMGLDDRTGRLAVGMQADLVMVDTRALNLWPVHDPVATALQANGSNIEAVMVSGQWRKRNGRLLYDGIDNLLAELEQSGRRVLGANPPRP